MKRLMIGVCIIIAPNVACASSKASMAEEESNVWKELSTAIIRGNIDMVRKLVPDVISNDAKNPGGLRPVDIANNAKKGYDEVASYLQSQLKHEQQAKEQKPRWTDEHTAVARALDNFLENGLSGNTALAKNQLDQAITHATNIINALESMNATSQGQTLRQKLEQIEEVVGKNNKEYAPKIKELYGWLTHEGEPKRELPTGEDVQMLRDGLDDGVVWLVKQVVPAKFKASDTMADGQKITTIAAFHKRRHDQIYAYLEMLYKNEIATAGTKGDQPSSPRNKRSSPKPE